MDTLLFLLVESATHFAPHGYCFFWDPPLLWGMVFSDLLIAASYYSIPLALITFAYKRSDNTHNHLLWKFGLFIMLCGTTHILYLWNIWHSNYYVELALKMATGIVSFYVAINVWKILPEALKLPNPGQLTALNKQLAESESRYRELFETANEGVLMVDLTGCLTMVNQTMTEILGVEKDQLLTLPLERFVDENDLPILREKMAQGFAGEKCRYEICCLHPSGKPIHALISSSQMCDLDNNATGLLMVVTDLSEKFEFLRELEILNQELEARVLERTSELKQANYQLTQQMVEKEKNHLQEKEAKARLDAVYNASPNGIIITNKLGIITDVNTATESMFGYKRSELISRHVNILTPLEFAKEHEQYIENADVSLTTKKLGFGRKLTAVRRYDTKFSVDVALTKIAHSDEHYYMAVIRDLTEIDVVEEELRTVNERLQESVDSMRRQTRETTLLNEYTELLQTSDNFEQYPAIISSYSQSILGALHARVYLLKDNNKLQPLTEEPGESFYVRDCWALKANHPYPLNRRQLKIPCGHCNYGELAICLPLNATGHQLGLITLIMPGNTFNIDDKTLEAFEKTLRAFAIRTSICLASLKSFKEKEMQSFKDELTGLYNRRFMNESLSTYFPRAKREQSPLTVLMIDIDFFKQFNDNYGHEMGDSVLVQVAHCIEQAMRESDLVCRLGGEEFLVVMYNATEEDGLIKANNIHNLVQTINSFPLPVTVSIGVAEKAVGDDVESLIRHADEALYEAKEHGRNQTRCYTLQYPLHDDTSHQPPQPNADEGFWG